MQGGASIFATLAAASLLCCAVPAHALATEAAETLPANLRDLLREAHPNERSAIVNVAKRLYPGSIAEIDALVSEIDEERRARVTQAGFVEGLRGDLSAGGYLSTGNTDEWGVSGTVSLRRQGRVWVHGLDLRIDVKDEDDERVEERLFANYNLRRNFSGSNWFAFAGLRYERDRFQGFASRFGQFVGAGYQIADSDRLKWEVLAGPGLRQTRFIDATDENQFGLFARTQFSWEVTDTLHFREDFSAGVGSGNDTYVSISSLTTNLYGDFSLRASFTVELETQPPPGREELETYSRLSVVYVFEP